MHLLNYNYVLFFINFKYLLILFFFILFNVPSNANEFLRLKENLIKNFTDKKFRDRRSINFSHSDWHLKIKEKAKTFGQSKKEIDNVYYYIKLINEAEIKKHSVKQNKKNGSVDVCIFHNYLNK